MTNIFKNEIFHLFLISTKYVKFYFKNVDIYVSKLDFKMSSNEQNKYKIIKDHITTLEIRNNENNSHFIKNPLDILFSGDYLYFSKEDIARIGFICGHMSKP